MKVLVWFLFFLVNCYAESITCKIKKIKIKQSKCLLTLMVDKETKEVNLTSSMAKCKKASFKAKGSLIASKSEGCQNYVFKINMSFDGKVTNITKAAVHAPLSTCSKEGWEVVLSTMEDKE